jgi:hypothetical protein
MMRIRPLCHLSGSYDQAAEYSFATDERKSRPRPVSRAKNGQQATNLQNLKIRYDASVKPLVCSENHRTRQRPRGRCLPCYRARDVRDFGPNVVLGMSQGQMLTRPMLRHLAGSLLFQVRMPRSDCGSLPILTRPLWGCDRHLKVHERRFDARSHSRIFHRACRRTAFELPGRTSYHTVTRLPSSSSTVDG